MEEDIKILEEYLNKFAEYMVCTKFLTESLNKLENDLKNFLTRYKQLEEENTDLMNLANNKQWISPCYVAHNYIPKSKIQEKIEEIDYRNYSNLERTYKKEVLQELLEE